MNTTFEVSSSDAPPTTPPSPISSTNHPKLTAIKSILFVIWFLPILITLTTSIFILRMRKTTPFAVSLSLLHATTVLTVTAMACYFSVEGSVALNEHLCKLWITLELFFSNNSLLHLAFFSLDAYLHLVSFVARQSPDASNGSDDDKTRDCFRKVVCNFNLSGERVDDVGLEANKNTKSKVSLVWLVSPWIVSTIQSFVEFVLDEAEVKAEDMTLESGLCFIPEKNFVLLGFWFSYIFPMFMALGFAKLWKRKLREYFASFNNLNNSGNKKSNGASSSVVNFLRTRLPSLNLFNRDIKRSYSYHRLDKSPLSSANAPTNSTPPTHLHKFFLLSTRMEVDPANGLGFQSLKEGNQIMEQRSIECQTNSDDKTDINSSNSEQREVVPEDVGFYCRDLDSKSKQKSRSKLRGRVSSTARNFNDEKLALSIRSKSPPALSSYFLQLKNGHPSELFVFSEKKTKKKEDNDEEKYKIKEENVSAPCECGGDVQERFLDRTSSTTNLLPAENISFNNIPLHHCISPNRSPPPPPSPPHHDHHHQIHPHTHFHKNLCSRTNDGSTRDGSAPNFSNFSSSKEKHTSGITAGLSPKVPSSIHPSTTRPLASPRTPHAVAVTPRPSTEHFSPSTHRMVMKLLLVYCLAWFPLQIGNVVYAVCFWRDCRTHVTYAEVMTFKWMAYASAFVCNMIVVLSLPK